MKKLLACAVVCHWLSAAGDGRRDSHSPKFLRQIANVVFTHTDGRC